LNALDFDPRFTSARPKKSQIGAVARSEEPCIVAYRKIV
jgi:hypothetical protein